MRFRVLCLLMAVVMVLPMGSSAEGFVSPVQALSSGIVKLASVALSSVSDALSELGGTLSDKMGSFGNGFKDGIDSFITLLGADPPDGEEEEHNLDVVYWNCDPNDKENSDAGLYLVGGNDEFDGADDQHPVLTFSRAVEVAAPGATIVALSQEVYNFQEPEIYHYIINGDVEGEASVLEYYPGLSSFFHVTGGVYLTVHNLNMTDDRSVPNRRLMLLDYGRLVLGSNVTINGTVELERLLPDGESAVTVSSEMADNFADNAQITFKFQIDDPAHHAGEDDPAANATYFTIDGPRDIIDLVRFPEGYDASALIDEDHAENGVIRLDHSLCDENTLDYVWKLCTKSGEPNVIQAYLARPYDGAIYISGNGNDEYQGLFPNRPVKTFDRAIQILTGTAPDSEDINRYRQQHGGYQVNEGVIRVVWWPVPVGTDNLLAPEVWTMPADTWWVDENGVRSEPTYVERYVTYPGDMISVASSKYFRMHDITIKGNKSKIPASGSVLTVGGLAVLGEGSLITENHAADGGGVTVFGGELRIDGGRITNCEAEHSGGGVYSFYASVNMTGGEISGNTAENGGGIHNRTAELKISGGEIRNNTAVNGAGVYLQRPATDETEMPVTSAFRFSGGAVKTNTASGNGGGIYLGRDLTGEGETGYTVVAITAHGEGEGILGNIAARGGGVYTCGDFTVFASDAAQALINTAPGWYCTAPVTGNNSSSSGGGWYADGSDLDNGIRFTLDGGEIKNNNGGGSGAGITLVNAEFTMRNAATVHDNTLTVGHDSHNGAGVLLTGARAFRMNGGCKIYHNQILPASDRVCNTICGGGVYVSGSRTSEEPSDDFLIAGEIYDNHLVTNGYTGDGFISTYYLSGFKGCGAYFTGLPLKVDGAKIYDNEGHNKYGESYGHGLYHENGKLLITGGAKIYNNSRVVTSSLSNYPSHHCGGGVYKSGGSLMIESCYIYDNPLTYTQTSRSGRYQGGGVYVKDASSVIMTGGSIYNNDSDYLDGGGMYIENVPTVSISGARFQGNGADNAGGGLYLHKVPASRGENCAFSGNKAVNDGGGLFINNNDLTSAQSHTVTDSVFTNNRANRGGAAFFGGRKVDGNYNYAFSIGITGSSFAGNTAAAKDESTPGLGGAIFNQYASVTLHSGNVFDEDTSDPDNVISGNTADRGGAIYNDVGSCTLTAEEGETPTAIHRNIAPQGAGIYTNTGSVYLRQCDLTGNDNETADPVWRGPAAYSQGGFIHLNAADVNVDTIYLYNRNYPVRLIGAPADSFEVDMDLNVSAGSDFFRGADTVITPYGDVSDASPYEDNFILIREAAAAYNLIPSGIYLVLAPRSVYIDGVAGDDARDGTKPTTAVRTFARARELMIDLLNGAPTAERTIWVVDTVTVSDTQVWSFAGETMPLVLTDPDTNEQYIDGTAPITGVKLLAYCPENTPFKNLYKSMVLVNEQGDLTMEGIEVNANRSAFPARCPQFGVRLTGTEEQSVSFEFRHNAAVEDDTALLQNCYSAVYAKYGDVTLDHVKIYNNHCNSARSNDTMKDTYGAGVTVHYGILTANDITVLSCTGMSYGAGFFLNHATATITDMTGESCSVSGRSLSTYNAYSSQLYGCSINGGCIRSADSDLTLNDSSFTKNNASVGGSAVSILRGTFNANDVEFTQNGTQTTSDGTYGILQIAGAATAVLTGVTFTSNKGFRGGGLRLESGAPDVTIKGCSFTSNYSYHGGSAIYSLGNGRGTMPTITVLPDERGDEPVRTQFSSNTSYYYFGTVLAMDTNLYMTDTDMTGNRIEQAGYSSASSQTQYTGGTAILHRNGALSLIGCAITGNRTVGYVNGTNNYNTYGTVASLSATSVLVEDCDVSNNVIDDGSSGYTHSLVGAGMSVVGSCPEFRMVRSTVKTNVIINNNTSITVNTSFNGGGLYVSGGTAVMEDNDFRDNKFTAAGPNTKYLRGAALYSNGADITIKNIDVTGCTAGNRDIIRLTSSSRIRMEGDIVMDGSTQDLVLMSKTTPIELTGPLNAIESGTISLSFDETFCGKPIVKGYTEDFASPELDADVYLPESANPRFTEAPEPVSQQLYLAPGVDEYDHDIVVGSNHVYLSDSGVDDEAHGDSPLTPVKTFSYAKQRLATRSAGADIIIVNSGVTVDSAQVWTLPVMTDSAGNSWKPRIARYMNPNNERSACRYTGVLVRIPEGGWLELSDIEINGRYSATNIRVVADSVLKNTGGTLRICEDAHITDNMAGAGALLHITGGETYILDGALLNLGYGAASSSSNTSGCGVYINGGTLEMTGGEISTCGPQYYGGCGGDRVFSGALVCLSTNGIFRFLGGVLRDARIYGSASYKWTGETSRKFSEMHGAVCVSGNRYNAETGTGVLFVCKGTIRDNFWYQEYAKQNGGNVVLSLQGSAIYMNNGTAEIGDGALITRNYSTTTGTYVSSIPIYLSGNAMMTVQDGAVIKDHQPDILKTGSYNAKYGYQHYYCIYMTGSLLKMDGGDISDIDVSYIIHMYNSSTFIMNGGELHPSVESWNYANASAVYVSGGSATINGGKIWSPAGRGNVGVYGVGSNCSVTINGNDDKYCEITGGYKAGVWMSGYQSVFRMNGGRIHDITDGDGVGVRSDGGSSRTLTFDGGFIYNNIRGIGLWQANANVTINKCSIHHNQIFGIGLLGSSTLKITSDAVDVYNNASSNNGYSRGIYASNGTFTMTGGSVHDNNAGADGGGGGIYVGGNITSCKIDHVTVSDNYRKGAGAGIEFGSDSSYNSSVQTRTHNFTVTDCLILRNEATGHGGGLLLNHGYNTTSGWRKYNYTFSNLNVWYNKSNGHGGGLYSTIGYNGEQTLSLTISDCDFDGNSAAKHGGGIALTAGGWGSETTSAKQMISVAEINTTKIRNNTAGSNGGGVYIGRNNRVNTKMETTFNGKTTSIEDNKAGVNGGGIYAVSSTGRAAKENGVYLPNLVISGNQAGVDFDTEDETPAQWADGGGIAAQNAYIFMNNTIVNGNGTNRFGGGIAALDGSEFMIQMGQLKNNKADGGENAQPNGPRGNGLYMTSAKVQMVDNLMETGENDDFYITRFSSPLLMYNTFTDKNRIYKLYPGEDEFESGDIVVHPTGLCTNASDKLNNFVSIRPGTVLERRYPDIIIGKILFLDGVNGKDPTFYDDGTFTYYTDPGTGVIHDGTSPEKALYTFAACKKVLNEQPGAIYVCGTVTVSDSQTWSLAPNEYLRRYCGFKVPGDTTYDAFLDDMFVIAENGDLTLENITIQGSYNPGPGFTTAKGSVFAIDPVPTESDGSDTPSAAPTDPTESAKLTVGAGTVIKDNITTGDGSAIRIEQGEVHITGGEITGNTTTGNGNAIWQGDTLTVQGKTLKIDGDVYLVKGNREENIADRVITVLPVPAENEDDPPVVEALDFKPADNTKISVTVENPYHGRDVAVYPEGDLPADDQKAVWELTPEVAAVYILDNEPARTNVLELRLPYIIYIDGVDGHDVNNGLTPETAVRTSERAYELIKAAHFAISDPPINGGLVYVVNTVTVSSEMSLGNHYKSGSTDIDAYGTVMFKRYSQPVAHASLTGYNKPTHKGPLFEVVMNGVLTFDGVLLDGHSQPVGDPAVVPEPTSEPASESGSESFSEPVSGTVPETTTVPVTEPASEPGSEPGSEPASDPDTGFIPVPGFDAENDPKLIAPGVKATAALVNVKSKGKVYMTAGTMQNAVSTAQTGAAITVNKNGIVHISAGSIKDCLDDRNVHIYDNGDLRLSGSPDLAGRNGASEWIYLEAPAGEPEVRVTVPAAFTPSRPVNVNPATPFNGRDIVRYADALGVPQNGEKEDWNLPAAILAIYDLNNNPDDAQILELQRKGCVYINGVSGNDEYDGSTPDTAVRTLERAYEILHSIHGVTVYVVDEVTITGTYMLNGAVFSDGIHDPIEAGGDVQFIRYSQPTGYNDDDPGELAGYSKPSCLSPLFTIADNASLYAAGVSFDGHSYAVTAEESPGAPQFVSPGVVAKGALIKVCDGGELTVENGVKLQYNNDTLPGGGRGGAVENSGTFTAGQCLIANNIANYGSGVYQDGDMTLKGELHPEFGEKQQVYLTGLKGSADEHIIEIASALDETFTVTLNFQWPQGGRNAVHFANGTFAGDVSNETEHFPLAPEIGYILVKSPETTEPNILELCEVYTLRYNGNGGKLPDGTTAELDDPGMPYNAELGVRTYMKGDIIEVRNNAFGTLGSFSQTGRTFVAWNTKPDGTGKTFLPGDDFWSSTVGIFQSTVLYAVWDTDEQYTVTYKPNNGIDSFEVTDGPHAQMSVVTVKFNAGTDGTGFTVPEGKKFCGWNTQPDESGEWYFPPGADIPGVIPTVTNEDGQFIIAGNIVLYAIYRTLSPYSLTIFKYADMRDLREPNKTFLFEIEDIWPLSDNYGAKYYVYLGTYTDAVTGETVPAWIDNSYCYTTVTGLPESKYLISEVTDWSWRYTLTDAYGADTVNYAVSAEKQIVASLTDHRTVSFKNELTNPYYVNGYARSWSNTFMP